MPRMLLLLALIATPLIAFGDEPTNDPLVVHEWGTFTTIAGETGGSLEWRPLAGPSDLPSFVYDSERPGIRLSHTALRQKAKLVGVMRMETPVIYFYTAKERVVEVSVGFPSGQVTEWYPRARSVGNHVTWGRVRLVPGAKELFHVEPGESHYYPARETDAVPIKVCDIDPDRSNVQTAEYEKFLFYRGVGNFELPLTARLSPDGEQVFVKNSGATASHLFLFRKDGKRLRWSVRAGLSRAEGEVLLTDREGSQAGLEAELVARLEIAGLYRKEALAMVKTWRDHWFTDGARVFYVVPRTVTDEILPLTVTPQPDSVVRVLVGRVELLTPAFRREVRALAHEIAVSNPAARPQLEKRLAALGRFAEPILEEFVAQLTDPVVKKRVASLLAR